MLGQNLPWFTVNSILPNFGKYGGVSLRWRSVISLCMCESSPVFCSSDREQETVAGAVQKPKGLFLPLSTPMTVIHPRTKWGRDIPAMIQWHLTPVCAGMTWLPPWGPENWGQQKTLSKYVQIDPVLALRYTNIQYFYDIWLFHLVWVFQNGCHELVSLDAFSTVAWEE